MNKVYSVRNSNFNSKNHIIFICDHASGNIDKRYRKKFTDAKILDSHVSYDIGAKNLTLYLAKQLKQSCILSNFSRLLIDPNRSKTDKDLIVSTSFGMKIPINNNIENVVLATHNSESIDYSISLSAKNNIMYAQLLGMGDNISNNLVKKNKKVFKYVPYGNIFELYPYLLRRLYENMDMIKHLK